MDITNSNVRDWLNDIDDAKKREKDYCENGQKILDIYNSKHPEKIPFNILYSNTETLVPALYSQTPRPVVKRRFNQEVNPLVQAVEQAGTRMLEYLLDTNMEGYERFDESMLDAVKDASLPGRGVTQIKFDAKLTEDEIDYPLVCTDSKKWNRVIFGEADKWAQMPWIAFEDYLDKDECEELFGDKANDLKYSDTKDDDDDLDEDKKSKVAQIYQVWDKTQKKVFYISHQYDGFLREDDDPMEISGFFPIPRPLTLIRKANDLEVTALYTTYQNQAKELNRITTRLNRVIEAIKVRVLYDGNISDDLERLMAEDDNAFVPTEKGSFMNEGGFDKSLWMMPIEKLVSVAQTLFQSREQCKMVIYEITGISDILRGMSHASETLGAQKIKETWGTMRLKNMQRDVQKYVRDSLRIMLDVASNKIPERFWRDYTGLPYPTADEKAQAQQQLQMQEAQYKEQVRAQLQQAQMQGAQPQEPQPFQPDQQLLQVAQSPSWTEILEILNDDFLRSYRIDIETNSTLDIEATEDKQQVAEFMNAIAQFMNGLMPMVQGQMLPFGAAKSMMLEIVRRYRFGVDVEDEIKQMQEPPQQNPEEAFKQLEQAKKQFEGQQKQAGQQLQKQQQELQKGFEEMQKVKDTFEQEKKKAGDELDGRFFDLEKQQMQFDYERKIAEERLKIEQELQDRMMEMDADEAKMEIKALIEEHKRSVQSMLDKHQACVKDVMTPKSQEMPKFPEVKIENYMPDGNKKISISRDESGSIDGAEVITE